MTELSEGLHIMNSLKNVDLKGVADLEEVLTLLK